MLRLLFISGRLCLEVTSVAFYIAMVVSLGRFMAGT